MAKRKSLSKRTRVEVLKRDKFKCQYCGSTAPNVVLEIDHIDPVSKGGTNDMLNLVTSCRDCNQGKSNIKLDDDSAISKQRNQLEDLQERREQIQAMFKWKKGLEKFERKTSKMLFDYIEKKYIGLFTLNSAGQNIVKLLSKKFELVDILNATDISADKYIKYDNDGEITKESAIDFLDKIGGILVNTKKSPFEQKVSYVKGICKNRFGHWDPKKGSIILNNYIKALRNYGYDDEQLLEDFENNVMPKTKEKDTWSDWRNLIEGWTEEIYNWGKNGELEELDKHEGHEGHEEQFYEYSNEELDKILDDLLEYAHDIISASNHIGSAFEFYSQSKFAFNFQTLFMRYLKDLEAHFRRPKEERLKMEPSFWTCYRDYTDFPKMIKSSENKTHILSQALGHIFTDYFEFLYSSLVLIDGNPQHFNYIYDKYLEGYFGKDNSISKRYLSK